MKLVVWLPFDPSTRVFRRIAHQWRRVLVVAVDLLDFEEHCMR